MLFDIVPKYLKKIINEYNKCPICNNFFIVKYILLDVITIDCELCNSLSSYYDKPNYTKFCSCQKIYNYKKYMKCESCSRCKKCNKYLDYDILVNIRITDPHLCSKCK